MKTSTPPPVYTLLQELLAWTLDRTAGLPKSQRHTFAQRLDGFTMDALERCLEARYATAARERVAALSALNLLLEKLRTFWRITAERGWISAGQLFFVAGKIDEIGRMGGAWRKATEK